MSHRPNGQRLYQLFEYPDREATLTLEISRLYESTHLKARGIARVSVAESHLNHVQDRKTYFSVEPVKGEILKIL